ncbi:RHS repeat-associated core domain-containing protein [Umezawaea beigongshangensis]|uniref:RHS repeat-associated core domain-containing protein n=1 Tax=Umezawaea beigongshangensis TaxID=2780383 RepID=UPI0018F10D1E
MRPRPRRAGEQSASHPDIPYGATTATGAAAEVNPFRWLGGYQLKDGVYTLCHRYYNTTHARFTAPDPTGQETNPYAYAQGDPINRSDPTGAYSVEEFRSDLGTIADTIAVVAVVGGIIGCAIVTAGTCLAGAATGAFYGGAVGLGFGFGVVAFW